MVGLADATDAVRRVVGKIGGSAYHAKRGLQNASEATKERVSRAGNRAKHKR